MESMTYTFDTRKYLCVWPDGTKRHVRIQTIQDGKATISWFDPVEGCDDYIETFEVVPGDWLEYINQA